MIRSEQRYVTTMKPNLSIGLDERKEVLSSGAVGVDFHRLAAPNLAKSEVLKMLAQEERVGGQHHPAMQWPPQYQNQQQSFTTTFETSDVKKVEWPPAEDESAELQNQPSQFSSHNEPPPATMSLRQEVPLRQEPVIFQTYPTAKKAPTRWRGDLKWPPEYCREVPEDQQSKKEIVKPKKQRKDYSAFFDANQLPNTYPGYRVPPGTQYFRDSQQNMHSDM